MASGDIVGIVLREMPPATLAAAIDTRAGGSTPAESVLVHDFDDGTDEYLDFLVQLEGYGGSGLTIKLRWTAEDATSGVCVWEAAIRRLGDDAEAVDSAHDYASNWNTVSATAANVTGEVDYADITFTDGADMDSWADTEVAIVRIGRNAVNGSDTMTNDAELWGILITET